MKTLGYVVVDSYNNVFGFGGDLAVEVIEDPHDAEPVGEEGTVCALVPVADLDVEAAVERAARVAYQRRVDALGITVPDEWSALLPSTRDGWCDHVRPIVLAALDVTLTGGADRCPRCGHMPHVEECLNMASDNDCSCGGAK